MEGQNLLVLGLAGACVVAAIVERARSRRMEKLYDDADRKLHASLSHGSQSEFSLISNAPFPACYANHRGEILYTSQSFIRFVGKEVGDLNAVNAAVGAHLKLVHSKSSTPWFFTDFRGDDPRRFMVVAWPVGKIGAHTGIVFAFLEQTNSNSRQQTAQLFQREVMLFQKYLLSEVKNGGANIEALTESAELLARVAQENTERVISSNAADIVRDIIESFRKSLRTKEISLTSTLPHQAIIVGKPHSLATALTLIFEMLIENGRPHTSVRCSLNNEGKHVVCTLELPGVHFEGQQHEDAFAFGKHSKQREVRLRFALARLLITEQHGSFTLTEDDENQSVVARIALPAEKPE